MNMEEQDFPALYKSADSASLKSQVSYFNALRIYLIFLILAAFVSFFYQKSAYAAIVSAAFFLITLLILILLKV